MDAVFAHNLLTDLLARPILKNQLECSAPDLPGVPGTPGRTNRGLPAGVPGISCCFRNTDRKGHFCTDTGRVSPIFYVIFSRVPFLLPIHFVCRELTHSDAPTLKGVSKNLVTCVVRFEERIQL